MEEQKFKILVIDDIPKNIQIIANTLGSDRYTIAFATNGEDGITHATENDFDLILLDVSMPGMNGFEVSTKLKRNERSKDTPIIFITALSEVENVLKGFEVGAVDYITKPFNQKELEARVNTQLEIKKQRDIIKDLNSGLEQKVNERTVELIKANEKLKVLEKAKSDFLTLISHELRTPLYGILGFAEILNETVQDDESKEFIKNLMDSAKRLSRLAEAALLITSLQAKKYPVKYKKADLIEIIKDTIKELSDRIDEKELTVKEFYATEEILAAVDITLLKKCLSVILENAVKFSHRKGKITVSLSSTDDNFEIAIRDNGDGFSDEAKTQLYDFFATNNVMNHTEGFGLGLAAVKLILNIHNGKIKINNLEPTGAEVILSLPKKR